MYRIGLDIGGTKINIGVFDGENKLLEHKKIYVADVENITECLKENIHCLCEAAGVPFEEVGFCGAGIPGTVSDDGKKIIKAPNISVLGENFAGELEDVLHIPVRLVQDSRAAAWGEYLCGAGKNADTVVCFTLGTGIGTGIVTGGKIYPGALGCAGELGHLPVKENGRACGCGKTGCLEKYCAGLGLDITAGEVLGEGKKAPDLFAAAENGDEKAANALDEAVRMLGAALVSVVNLLSPDCILFSGGLSEQEKLYVTPVIDYIASHCYRAEKLPVMKKAALGELAPLYGAALIPFEGKKRTPLLSASIMCADILHMGDALTEIKAAGIEYIHCDIMDNHFVPNLMLPMELLNKLKKGTDLPFDFHIMAENPESIIEKLNVRAGDIISVHAESTNHLQRAVTLIRQKGARAAVAINPSTPIETLSEILPELDMVLIMTVNPGFAGQKLAPGSFDKIARMRRMLDRAGARDVLLEVDGNCSFENVPKMYRAGADLFVVGTSSVFGKDISIADGVRQLYERIEA